LKKKKVHTCTLSGKERIKGNKIDYQQQTVHHLLSHATPGVRECGGATKDTIKSQVWLSDSVTHAIQKTQTLLICLHIICNCQQLLRIKNYKNIKVFLITLKITNEHVWKGKKTHEDVF